MNEMNPLVIQSPFAYEAWERIWKDDMTFEQKSKLIRGIMKPIIDERILGNTVTSVWYLTFAELPFNFQYEILNYYLKKTNQPLIELKIKKLQ